jgi:hypothetical protein
MRILNTVIVFVLFIFGGPAMAHQFVPTYPKFTPSFIEGILQTRMELFNKRSDAEYYEVDVFDSNWNTVTFATESKLIYIKHLQTKKINIYIKAEDLKKVTYICTESRIRKEDATATVISSKICSKVK